MRLYSSVIRLLNLHPVTIAPPGGGHAHGAFFDIVERVDPALSQALHDIEGKGARKPFTVSPIMGLPRHLHHEGHKGREGSPKGEIFLREGWACWLRVTILDEHLFRLFIAYFLDGNGKEMPKIRLGDAHFAVSEILTTPGSHPWAGFTTLSDLQKRLDAPPPQSIMLEFHSPTSFSLGKKEAQSKETIEINLYPRLVFGNLATAWKALTGEDVREAVEKYAEANLRYTPHRLVRDSLTLKNHPQLGMKGRVEYQFIHPEDTPAARAIHLLADLAFYTGVGRKTTQGMGQTRRLPTP
ncbi:MAG: CRISPR system precrRNA processing endoribonuclease RAMP protein Cas6 [Anaerolineales bacterium]